MPIDITGRLRSAARPRVWIILIALAVCIFSLGNNLQSVLLQIGIWGIAGVGLGLVLGFAGQISLSQAAFVGVGAFTYAIGTKVGAPPLAAAIGGAVMAAALAAAVSPILRIKGYYLAIATIVLNLLLSALAISSLGVPGGSSGMAGVPYLEAFGLRFDTVAEYAALSLSILGIFTVAAHLRYGRGRRWRAIQALRHDDGLASGLGLNVVGMKRELFTVSGAAAGLAGAILAAAYGFVSPGQFSYATSFMLALAVFIGGSLSLWGAVLGVALLEASAPLLGDASALHGLLVGIVALITVRIAPDGWITRRTDVSGIANSRQPRQPHKAKQLSTAPVRRRAEGGIALQTAQIGLAFGSFHALRDVSVNVRPGSVVGLIGPNGAGKTSLLNVIAGEAYPTSGDVWMDGRAVTGLSPYRRARLGLVRTYQQSRIISGLSVIDNIILGVDGLSAAGAGRLPREHQRGLATQAAIDAGAAHLLSKSTHALTFGERRLVELARLLVGQPRLALLDEPFSGLSHAEGEALGSVIRTLKARGTTVVLVEHAIPFVLALADSLIVMNQGTVLAAGAPAKVIELDAVRESYLGSVLEDQAS